LEARKPAQDVRVAPRLRDGRERRHLRRSASTSSAAAGRNVVDDFVAALRVLRSGYEGATTRAVPHEERPGHATIPPPRPHRAGGFRACPSSAICSPAARVQPPSALVAQGAAVAGPQALLVACYERAARARSNLYAFLLLAQCGVTAGPALGLLGTSPRPPAQADRPGGALRGDERGPAGGLLKFSRGTQGQTGRTRGESSLARAPCRPFQQGIQAGHNACPRRQTVFHLGRYW